MKHPVIALVWECWRLSRRWYLWVLPLVFVIDLTLLSRSGNLVPMRDLPPNIDRAALGMVVVAPGIFMITFTLAIFATMMALSVGNRAGFPLAFEFRLPIKTPALVAVPMLTLATLCASLYVLPMLVCRLFYDLPFPLLPGCMLIASLVFTLLTCSWSMMSSATRTFAMIFGMVASMQIFALLDPVDLRPLPWFPGQPPPFNPAIVALSAGEYALLAGLCLLLFAATSASIRNQRCGEALALQVPGTAPAKPRKPGFSLSALAERAPDLFVLPCPVSSPLRAELWLELKRQVTPILLLGALIAVAIPVLFMFGLMPERRAMTSADYLFPYAAFFSGIGLAIFNRRQATAGYMSAFEGTRGMSTLRLASVQILSVAAGTLLGVVIVCASVYFSSRMLDEPGNLARRLQELLDATRAQTPLLLLADAARHLVMYVSFVALLACVHTWSVVWGRWVPYGAGVLAIYGVIFTVRVQEDSAAMLDAIKQHMWGFAIAVFALTLLAFGRTLYLKILSLRAGLVTLLCWGGFVACSIYSLAQQGTLVTQQASELQAFNAALFLLPLLLFALLLWSYDRMRHR